MGMFGVLTEVSIRVTPKFKLDETRSRVRGGLDTCLEDMFQLSNSDEFQYVKFWVDFLNDFCVIFETKVTTASETEEIPWYISFLTVRHYIILYSYIIYIYIIHTCIYIYMLTSYIHVYYC